MIRNWFPQADVPTDPSNRKAHDMTRRRLLRLSAGGGLVLLSGGVAWWGGERTPALFRGSRAVMGTRGTIVLAHPSRTLAAAALEAAFAELSEAEHRMSRFGTDSDVGRLNSHRDHWLVVAPSTATVLCTALDLARVSDGQFDPCLDRLVSLWEFHDRHYPDRPPCMPPEFRNVGHEFYRGLRHRRQVGIRHPRQPGALLKVLSLREQAVATSGDYANCFFYHGQRYAHVLDPCTGCPTQAHRSLTVVAPSAMLADALATAAFTVDPARVAGLLTRTNAESWFAVDAGGRQYGS